MKIRMPAVIYISASILLIWLGFAIRLHDLGNDSMWWDEIATLQVARNGLQTALEATRDHPPLAYVFTAVSIQTWGETEFAARLPAFFAGVLTIPLMLLLGKLLRRPWVGLWAALFLVFSPFHLKYSQEVRHYALLLLLSLGSYAFLYRAMLKPSRLTGAIYAVLTALMLYTHYGGFVVLATQLVMIALWLGRQLYRQKYTILPRIIPPLILIPLLYLPWLPRFLTAINYNTSEETLTGTGTATTLLNWGREAFSAFGMVYGWRPWLFLALAVLGLLIWPLVTRRRVYIFIVIPLVLPLLFIQIFSVVRGAYARYIIYLLPFYLLLAAIVPVALSHWLARRPSNNRLPSKSFLTATLGLAIIFSTSSLTPLQNEYQFIQSDWKGIVQYLEENAAEDDIILGLSFSNTNGFNPVYHAFPYYLQQSGRSYNLLESKDYEVARLKSLPADQKVFAILSNWDTPTRFEDSSIEISPYSYYLFVLEDTDQDGPVLDRIYNYYEQSLAIAGQPIAYCLIYKNLAAIEAARDNFLAANDWLNTSRNDCDTVPEQVAVEVRGDTKTAIFNGLLEQMEAANQAGSFEEARRLAAILRTFDPKHPAVLETLTAVNLQQQFEQGFAVVNQGEAPEPIGIRPFIMPQSGDNGEALFIHPPAAATFTITLPDEPLIFSSRIALAPESWAWGGDGVTFILTLETAEGETIELLHQYIENIPANQTWRPIEIPLTPYAGQTISLTLTTENGPAGDGDGDWAGWETPRILYQVTIP